MTNPKANDHEQHHAATPETHPPCPRWCTQHERPSVALYISEASVETLTDDEAVAEAGWVAREALALTTERVDEHSERWQDYFNRKRALSEYIEATR